MKVVYPDGSEFTTKHFAIALALGAVGGTVLTALSIARENRKVSRIVRRRNHPSIK